MAMPRYGKHCGQFFLNFCFVSCHLSVLQCYPIKLPFIAINGRRARQKCKRTIFDVTKSFNNDPVVQIKFNKKKYFYLIDYFFRFNQGFPEIT